MEEKVKKIISFNHAWKLAQKKYGEDSNVAGMLRRQKSSLQADLLRSNLGVYLVIDGSNNGEELFSLRLPKPISINSCIRTDAEHMPVRIAKDLFTDIELTLFAKGKAK